MGCLLAVAVLLTACGGDPWVDSRREAGSLKTVGDSQPNRPAICYSGDIADVGPQLLAMANQVCAKSGTHARYLGSTSWQCRILTPHRAYFACE
jgi:hypothetical protein